jgi:hypothetical protein
MYSTVNKEIRTIKKRLPGLGGKSKKVPKKVPRGTNSIVKQ